jgi:hypothetical protein
MHLKRHKTKASALKKPLRKVSIPDMPEFLTIKAKPKPKKPVKEDTKNVRRYIAAVGWWPETEFIEVRLMEKEVYVYNRDKQIYKGGADLSISKILEKVKGGSWREITDEEWKNKSYPGAYKG